jgi:autophagy-related protein 5
LHAFFQDYLINPDVPPHEGWFTYNNVPLRWHFPVGLLYDLLPGSEPHHTEETTADETDPEQPVNDTSVAISSDQASTGKGLPWKLVLSFTEWPEDQLVGLDAEGKIIHDAFINSVKEVRNVVVLFSYAMWIWSPHSFNIGRLSAERDGKGCHVSQQG